MRPIESFHGFIGQANIIASVTRLVDGCLASGKPFPNTLLTGPSGGGKTHLAKAIGKAFGTKVHYVLCGREVRRADICDKLTLLEEADFLFLDEVHALPKVVQEVVYPAIDDGQTFRVETSKQRPTLTDEWIGICPFTLFAATDRPGELRNALRRRLPQTYALIDYAQRELKEIVAQRASDIGILLTPQAANALAKVSRGNPRSIRHLLERLTLYYPGDKNAALGVKQVNAFLKNEGIGKGGVNSADRAYLRVLADRNGSPCSLSSIALAIGHDDAYVATEIEAYLVRLGLVAIERTGRTLTAKGWEFYREGGAK